MQSRTQRISFARGEGVNVLLRGHSRLFFGITTLLDVLLVAAAWILAYMIRFHWGPALVMRPAWLFSMQGGVAQPFAELAILLPVVILCNLVALGSVGLYQPLRPRSRRWELRRVCKASFLAWIGMLAVFYFLRQSRYSLKMVTLFLMANTFALMVSRYFLRKILSSFRARGIGLRHIAIIGIGKAGQEALLRLRHSPWAGAAVQYFVDAENNSGKSELHGVPIMHCADNLLACLWENPVDAVFVAVPMRQTDSLNAILAELAKLPVTVAVVPDFGRAATLRSSVGEFEGMPIIQLRDTPICGWHAIAKRSVDIVGSLLGILIMGIPMFILALLVKLTDRGPILFKQVRMGVGGKAFNIWKFRSMRVDAEEESGPVWTVAHDPRCTLLGKLMRRTSLDELPQLFNVLRGDMSLVGPRPERPHFVEEFVKDVPTYMLRHNVKAGITGWAQINGMRGNTSLKKRLRYDLYYINNWSFGFDMLILLLTPLSGILGKNAY